MGIFVSLVVGVFAICAYAATGRFVFALYSRVTGHSYHRRWDWRPEGDQWAGVILWPGTLLIALASMMWELFFEMKILRVRFLFYKSAAWVLGKAAKALRPKPKPPEIADGIPRPSYVLAGMIATHMLRNPDNFDSVPYDTSYSFKYKGSVLRRRDTATLTAVDGAIYEFTHKEDIAVLDEAAAQTREFKKQMEANRIEYQGQQLATSLIEDLFKETT